SPSGWRAARILAVLLGSVRACGLVCAGALGRTASAGHLGLHHQLRIPGHYVFCLVRRRVSAHRRKARLDLRSLADLLGRGRGYRLDLVLPHPQSTKNQGAMSMAMIT